jgi:hypothetical protein
MVDVEGDGQDLQGIFTLTLSAIRVHGSHRQTLVVEVVIDHVAFELGVGEDQDATRLLREDEVEQGLVLLVLVDIDDVLGNVFVGAANATNLL